MMSINSGSAEYILPITLSTSIIPVSRYTRHRGFKMYLEAVIMRVWRFTWRARDRVDSAMYLEAMI